jgi:hypothetical protein
MAYVSPNFKTKKALKEAVKAGQRVTVFSPGGIGRAPYNGKDCVEGPHYPEPHRWYAEVTITNGVVTAVK